MAGPPAERISRFLTYLLRHQPKEYPLVFNKRGFVDWRRHRRASAGAFLRRHRRANRSGGVGLGKKRFEFEDGKVRATYGHSFPVDLGGGSGGAA